MLCFLGLNGAKGPWNALNPLLEIWSMGQTSTETRKCEEITCVINVKQLIWQWWSTKVSRWHNLDLELMCPKNICADKLFNCKYYVVFKFVRVSLMTPSCDLYFYTGAAVIGREDAMYIQSSQLIHNWVWLPELAFRKYISPHQFWSKKKIESAEINVIIPENTVQRKNRFEVGVHGMREIRTILASRS